MDWEPTTAVGYQSNRSAEDFDVSLSSAHLPVPPHSLNPAFEGVCVWQAARVDWEPTTSRGQRGLPKKHLDNYLLFLQNLFANGFGTYCEVKALQFLHNCDYDVEKAKSLLTPSIPDEEDMMDEEATERYEGDDICFICREGGELILCDYKTTDGQHACHKNYHPNCLLMEKVPDGVWLCPSHRCSKCHRDTDFRKNCCVHCAIAYCANCIPAHLEDDIVFGFLCEACLHRETNSKGLPHYLLTRVVKLHTQLGNPLTAVPVLNGKELDLVTNNSSFL
jgi:hypothetical protein